MSILALAWLLFPGELLENLSEALDLLTVERPVALTLCFHRPLVMGTGLCRERGRVRCGGRRRGRLDRRRLLTGCRRRRRAAVAREEPLQRLVERFLHHDLVLVRDDDALQFRNLSGRRPEVERADVEERFLDGNHQQRSLNDLRALLVPERD